MASTNRIAVRSIIAQVYLELVRVWTVNITGEWLFNRVESAGVLIETRFSRRFADRFSGRLQPGGLPPEGAAVGAIAGNDAYFRSEEKNDILARIRTHRSRGVDDWHFRKYDYMLCFDQAAFKALQVLRRCCMEAHIKNPAYARLAKVLLVKDLPMEKHIDHFSSKETKRLVDDIKAGIKSFLEKHYHWVKPVGISIDGGPLRTKQIFLETEEIKGQLSNKEFMLNEISNRIGCRIRITDEKFGQQLFSITGRKEALPLATSMVMEWLGQKT